VDGRNGRGFGDPTAAISNYRNSGLLLMELAKLEPQIPAIQKQLESVQGQLAALGATPLPVAPSASPAVRSNPAGTPRELSASSSTAASATVRASSSSRPTSVAGQSQQSFGTLTQDQNDAIQDYVNVSAKVSSADARLSELRQNLARRGLSVRPD